MRQLLRALAILLLIASLAALPAPAAAAAPEDRYYAVIYQHILRTTPSLGAAWADWEAKAILYYCGKWNVDPLLVTALFTQESGFSMEAYSRTGAVGIAQLMPGTAAGLGVDPYDPNQNVEGGVRYLSEQLTAFRDANEWTATFAVAAYNAGPQAVRQYRGIPPYSETIQHVNSVGAIYRRLLQQLS